MIRHIVIWTLKDTAHGRSKEENSRMIKQLLEDLNGKITGMIRLEVGFDLSRAPESGDIVLYSEFVDMESLNQYQNHPLHKKIMPYVMEARATRMMADYQTDCGLFSTDAI